MKCPYRNFEECLVEKCSSCNYRINEQEVIAGRYPETMCTESAIKQGYAWRETRKTYEFVSCKLIENGVQPIPQEKKVINNTTKTSIVVNKSIF